MRKEVQLDPFFHLQSKLMCCFGLGLLQPMCCNSRIPSFEGTENAISTIDNTLVAISTNLPQKRYLFSLFTDNEEGFLLKS